MRVFAIVAVIAMNFTVVSAQDEAATAPVEAASEKQTAPSPLDLPAFLKLFTDWDPAMKVAALRTARANISRDRALNPEILEAFARPGIDFVYVDGAAEPGSGSLSSGQMGVRQTGNNGMRYQAALQSTALVPGQTNDVGGELGIDLSVAIPLGRNRGGELHTLEGRYLGLDADASQANEENTRLNRCWQAVDFYLQAWYAQQKSAVFEEFIKTKKRRRNATSRDVRKGLLPKLASLTAKSAVLQTEAQQRQVQLQAAQSMETVLSLLAPDSEFTAIELQAPEEPLLTLLKDERTGLDDHPALRAINHRITARRAQADLVKANYGLTMDLAPGLAASRITGAAPTTQQNLRAGVSLELKWPITVGQKGYELSALSNQAQEAEQQLAQARSDLNERLNKARQRQASITARIEVSDERLKVTRAQIGAAWKRFSDGRIELQDYLQHYDAYEAVRLERIDLELLAALAQTEMARITRDIPEACR